LVANRLASLTSPPEIVSASVPSVDILLLKVSRCPPTHSSVALSASVDRACCLDVNTPDSSWRSRAACSARSNAKLTFEELAE
jgi:hypothetical protein